MGFIRSDHFFKRAANHRSCILAVYFKSGQLLPIYVCPIPSPWLQQTFADDCTSLLITSGSPSHQPTDNKMVLTMGAIRSFFFVFIGTLEKIGGCHTMHLHGFMGRRIGKKTPILKNKKPKQMAGRNFDKRWRQKQHGGI